MRKQSWWEKPQVLFVVLTVIIVVGWWSSRLPGTETIVAADGRPALLITCSRPADCLAEASRACPTGYKTLTSDNKTEVGGVYIGTGNSSGVVTPTETYSGARIIRCLEQ